MNENGFSWREMSKDELFKLLEAIPDLVFIMDESGKYLDVIDAGKEQMLYVPKSAIIGKTPYDLFDETLAEKFDGLLRSAFKEGLVQKMRYKMDVPEGRLTFEARVIALPERYVQQRLAIVIVRDISDVELGAQKERLLATVFSEATEGVMIEDEHRHVVFVNPAMERLLGMSQQDCLGKHSSFFSTMLDDEVNTEIYEAMTSHGHWHGEVELKRFDGKELLVWLSMDAIFDETNRLENIVIMATDISELRNSRDKLEYLATHDALTGIPNRTLLFDRLEHTIASVLRRKVMGAVLFIDLDNFKEINDNFGHQIGDDVLKEVAHRLKHAVRSSDTVGRFGGDEFVLIIEEARQVDEVMVIIQKIRDVFEEPLFLRNTPMEIRLSIGVALIPQDAENAEAAISAADKAMYKVKERGKDGFEFYSSDFSLISHEYFHLQRATRDAIKSDAFTIVYQPQFSIRDGRLTGAEALLRCTHESLKGVPIAKIISVAEESGMIREITPIVLRHVCRQIASWKELSLVPLGIAINLSRREIDGDYLVEMIEGHLNECCVTPIEIEFEITESTLMQSGDQAQSNIERLRQLGCRFSIDDFGTGYSSLSNLKEFNLDKLKIDKMFIDGLEENDDDKAIVSATISMGKKLGLTVLAEGVETEAQVALLKAYDCDEVQGFFYSRPVDAETMTELLRALNG